MSMGSNAMISKIAAKKIYAFAGMMTLTRVKWTITCRFLIELSSWFKLWETIKFKMTLNEKDAPTPADAVEPANAIVLAMPGSSCVGIGFCISCSSTMSLPSGSRKSFSSMYRYSGSGFVETYFVSSNSSSI